MSAVGQFFGGVGFVFDLVRKVMHFIVLALFFLILGASFTGETPPPVPSGAALLLDFDGPLVEQLSGDPVDRAVEELQGAPIAGVLVRQLVRAIDTAAEDDRISAIVMRLERLGGGGLTKYQLVADALDRFRASGKSVIVYGDGYTQSHYFLAAHADEVYLHPSGGVAIDGFGRFRTYYREAIDKLQIDWNVFKVGEYKSFVEPYLRDNMSAEDRASSMVWLNQLWDIYVADVSDARGLSAGVLSAYTENLAANLDKNGGNVAALAVDAGLVDALKNRDEFRSDMNGRFGPDSTTGTYKHIPFSDYIVAQGLADPVVRPGTDAVGVIVASGQILDGRQPSGTIGGDSLADLVRQATADNSLKGLVLVVDSGGGSKFASEVIQRELLGFKATGRPLIAYMSSVAASGGYWISMDADEIWANEATITGSIGIGGFFPTFQRSLDSLGIHVDGIGTTSLSGEGRLDRALSDDTKAIIQRVTEYGYQQFISSVAAARGKSVEDIDRIARGRVWSGKDALRLGLVDELGTLDDAIAAVAVRAGLGDDYGVRFVEKPLSFQERLALSFATRAQIWFGEDVFVSKRERSLRRISAAIGLDRLQSELDALARFNDPQGIYAYCFCRVD